MKIITYFILALVLINLFFLVGCVEEPLGKEQPPSEEEGTGINEVFEDTEEVTPPQIPT